MSWQKSTIKEVNDFPLDWRVFIATSFPKKSSKLPLSPLIIMNRSAR